MKAWKIILPEKYYIISHESTYPIKHTPHSQFVLGELFDSQGNVVKNGDISINTFIACFQYNY